RTLLLLLRLPLLPRQLLPRPRRLPPLLHRGGTDGLGRPQQRPQLLLHAAALARRPALRRLAPGLRPRHDAALPGAVRPRAGRSGHAPVRRRLAAHPLAGGGDVPVHAGRVARAVGRLPRPGRGPAGGARAVGLRRGPAPREALAGAGDRGGAGAGGALAPALRPLGRRVRGGAGPAKPVVPAHRAAPRPAGRPTGEPPATREADPPRGHGRGSALGPGPRVRVPRPVRGRPARP